MFVEDVGRHNAVDAIAGFMWLDAIDGSDKVFYTTGRLTSEMVIKCAQMRIPFLVSRSGLTHMGHQIAKKTGNHHARPSERQAFPRLHRPRAAGADFDAADRARLGGLGRARARGGHALAPGEEQPGDEPPRRRGAQAA